MLPVGGLVKLGEKLGEKLLLTTGKEVLDLVILGCLEAAQEEVGGNIAAERVDSVGDEVKNAIKACILGSSIGGLFGGAAQGLQKLTGADLDDLAQAVADAYKQAPVGLDSAL
jgi:hypothetical protein